MIKTKLRLIFSGLAILTLLVSSIPSLPASAEPTETFGIPQKDITADKATWTADKRTLSAVYARSLARCMTYSLENTEISTSSYMPNATQATTIQGWMDAGIISGDNVESAIMDPSGDGVLSCSNEKGWIDTALKLWQFNSKIEALCTFGWFRDTSTDALPSQAGSYSDCVNGKGGVFRNTYVTKNGESRVTTSRNLFFARLAIARNVGPTLQPIDIYNLYYRTFTADSGCKAKQLVSIELANADQKELLSGNSALQIAMVEGEGNDAKPVSYIYQMDGKTKDDTAKIAPYLANKPIANNDSPGNDGGNSCKYIAQIINQYAGDFLNGVVAGETTTGSLDVSSSCTTDTNGSCGTQSCGVEGIGWIICPVFTFLTGVADGTYSIIQGLLVTNVTILDTGGGTYNAWQIMRNFGNVGFVIAFLIIIFSQMTGAGITNYGVKKMLPRLIVAAILVNISFFICQGAVDLSNILGSSLKGLLDNVAVFDSTYSNSGLAKGDVLTTIGSTILFTNAAGAAAVGAGAAAYFGGIGLFIPIVLAFVVAVIMTLFILVARQALIILLIVVSPLAFLAMLLPNTENLFKQWRKIFVSMLLLYPIIGLLFGASQLAATILLVSLGGSDNNTAALSAVAVLVLPLFALPALLKGSLNAIPAIGNLATKLTNNATSATRKGAGMGTKALGERAAAGNGRFSRFAASSLYGRGREGKARQASARRAFEEPRIKDALSQLDNRNIGHDPDALLKEIMGDGTTPGRVDASSIEGQAIIGRLAQMKETDKLLSIKESFKGPNAEAQRTAYNKAIDPHIPNLMGKDFRSVLTPDKYAAKYRGTKAGDMRGMSDAAIIRGAESSPEFKQELMTALANKDERGWFTAAVKAKFMPDIPNPEDPKTGSPLVTPDGGSSLVLPKDGGFDAPRDFDIRH